MTKYDISFLKTSHIQIRLHLLRNIKQSKLLSVSQSVSQFYSILKKEDRACKNRVSGLMCERGGGNVKGKFVKRTTSLLVYNWDLLFWIVFCIWIVAGLRSCTAA